MPNPLDMVTQDQRLDDGLSPLERAISIRPLNDEPLPYAAPSSTNKLVQAVAPEAPSELMQGLAALADYLKNGEFSPGTKVGKLLFGSGGQPYDQRGDTEHFQTWPERMLRSGASLPGDVLSGELGYTPGLRREDVTDRPRPGGFMVSAEPGDPIIERSLDTAGLAGGSTLFARPGAATLGSGAVRPGTIPMLRVAAKVGDKVFEGKPGEIHAQLLDQHPQISKGVKSEMDLDSRMGFVDKDGKFLSREQAAKEYAKVDKNYDIADEPSLITHNAPVLWSDTSKPGAAVAGAAGSGPAPVFYSALEHAATNAAQDVMSPQQWLGYLKNQPGVKNEELAWTGIGDWLGTQKGKIKKEDVQKYLDEHKVEIKDVTKSGASRESIEDGGDHAYMAVLEQYRQDHPGLDWDGPNSARTWSRFDDWYEGAEGQRALEEFAPGGGTKYESYQLPGGENYREHLLTMPPSKTTSGADAVKHLQVEEIPASMGRGFRVVDNIQNAEVDRFRTRAEAQQSIDDIAKNVKDVYNRTDYRSSHWDEPNVLAHVRTNDRTMARELSPEYVAVNEARAKVQEQIETARQEQALVAREIGAIARPLENARRDKIRADIKAKRISGPDGLKAMEEFVEHPELFPLQDKLQELRAKEDSLRASIEDIVPKTMTDEQALAAAKDWVKDGGEKWENIGPVRQNAWIEQVQKVAGRKAMNEAEKPLKSLHIEEIQSDWHQQGRKQGYRGDNGQAEKAAKEYHSKYGAGSWEDLSQSDRNDLINGSRERLRSEGKETGVPDAPFKTSWPELALKRMIRHAAEEGYDRISWTPGEAQAARYDLSKSIDKIEYAPPGSSNMSGKGNGTLKAFKDGREVISQNVPPEKLADHIGKEAAQKLLDTEQTDITPYIKGHRLEGQDLKVGGEGMREFYDKMLPKMVEKIGKAHGVKVKQTKIQAPNEGPVSGETVMTELGIPAAKQDAHWRGLTQEQRNQLFDDYRKKTSSHDVHYFDIPQSLKDHAIGKGFPLYMSGIPFPLTPVDYDPFAKKQLRKSSQKAVMQEIDPGKDWNGRDQNALEPGDVQSSRVNRQFNREDH